MALPVASAPARHASGGGGGGGGGVESISFDYGGMAARIENVKHELCRG